MSRQVTPLLLSETDRRSLTDLITKGVHSARSIKRATVLLKFAEGLSGYTIADQLELCLPTVYQIRSRYQQSGLMSALGEKERSGRKPTFDGSLCAKVTALACSQAPTGHSRWTLRLLADKVIELGFAPQISHDSVKRILKKTNYSLTAVSSGASAK
jgi:transposase